MPTFTKIRKFLFLWYFELWILSPMHKHSYLIMSIPTNLAHLSLILSYRFLLLFEVGSTFTTIYLLLNVQNIQILNTMSLIHSSPHLNDFLIYKTATNGDGLLQNNLFNSLRLMHRLFCSMLQNHTNMTLHSKGLSACSTGMLILNKQWRKGYRLKALKVSCRCSKLALFPPLRNYDILTQLLF